MQNNENHPNRRRIRNFFREKGYYIVLGLCVCAVGVSGWLFVSNAVSEKRSLQSETLSIATSAEDPQAGKSSGGKTAPTTAPAAEETAPAAAMTDDSVREAAASVRVWPVSGEAQAAYSVDALQYNATTQDWRTHAGVDLTAAVGTPVRAAGSGVVTAVYDDEYLGTTVIVNHPDGHVSQYSNLAVMPSVSAGDSVEAGQTISIGGVPYTVVGVLRQSGDTLQEGGRDDQIYISYNNALKLMGSRAVNLYMFMATSRDTAAAAKTVIDDCLYDYYQDENAYYTMTMAEQVQMINAMMGVAMLVLVAIAAISLLVGGIGIMNIMLVSVTERTREIGIRKSLGAKRRDIRWQFIIEAGTTSAIGGVVGILFGCLVATVVGSLIGGVLVSQMGVGSNVTFSATPTTGAVLVSFGVSVGIGILFGYLPANKAAKLNPIDALRYD